jgi:hypothetical protein
MKNIFIYLILFFVSSAYAANINSNFLNGLNDYWVQVPLDYSNTSIPSCQSIIANKKKSLMIGFIQYNKNDLKYLLIVPEDSPARTNSSIASSILPLHRKITINNYSNVIENGNAFTVSYKGQSGGTMTDSYVYDKSKNLRFYVALDPADAGLQFLIDEAKKKGLPGSKEVKCNGPI